MALVGVRLLVQRLLLVGRQGRMGVRWLMLLLLLVVHLLGLLGLLLQASTPLLGLGWVGLQGREDLPRWRCMVLRVRLLVLLLLVLLLLLWSPRERRARGLRKEDTRALLGMRVVWGHLARVGDLLALLSFHFSGKNNI